ncbi:MAG: phosphoribosyltransferase [Nitrososphaera sp.]|nr:phosphoribosyltransferase [Nitrososphaera sp.]
MQFTVSRSLDTGILFLYIYTPRSDLMRHNPTPYNPIPYNFKSFGHLSDEFTFVIDSLLHLMALDFAVGIPSSNIAISHIQKVSDTRARFVARWQREKKHKGNERALDNETQRVQLLPSTHVVQHKTILLCDDIVTTGETMSFYRDFLLLAGAKKVVPFAIAHKASSRETTLHLKTPCLLPARIHRENIVA